MEHTIPKASKAIYFLEKSGTYYPVTRSHIAVERRSEPQHRENVDRRLKAD